MTNLKNKVAFLEGYVKGMNERLTSLEKKAGGEGMTTQKELEIRVKALRGVRKPPPFK